MTAEQQRAFEQIPALATDPLSSITPEDRTGARSDDGEGIKRTEQKDSSLLTIEGVEIPTRIAAKIKPNPSTGCFEWTGALDGRGYGNVRVGRQVRKAHRVVYEVVRGPVAPELDCDHLCRVPSCVRPSHLQPVRHVVNVRRGAAMWVPGALQRAKTHCPRGHAYTPANTYVQPSTGGRLCRACDREKKRAARQREKVAA